MSARGKAMALILLALLLAAAVTMLYCAIIVGDEADDRESEIWEDRIMTPSYTPVPAPEQWVRYSVPLDDDLQKYIEKLCREKEVPSPVVIAIVGVETEGTFDICDPDQTIREIVDRLSELITTYDGDWDAALSFYNGDSTGRYAERVQAYAECLAEGVMQFNE